MEVIVVYSLCIIFAFLIIYHMFNKSIIEANTNPQYDDYSKDDALILAKQNAGNIKFLKQKFDTVDEFSKKVNTLSESVDSNTESISQILKAQKEQTDKLNMDDSSS